MKREDLVAWLRAREAYAEELHSHDAVRYREAADALERLTPAEGELVEAVAHIVSNVDLDRRPWTESEAAARAIIPLILERAAKVAEEFQPVGWDHPARGYEIAAAIRSLGRPST